MEDKIPLIFIAVKESKYPKVTRRRFMDLTLKFAKFCRDNGWCNSICGTVVEKQLVDCDAIVFSYKYNDVKSALLYSKCRFDLMTIFMEKKNGEFEHVEPVMFL